jgi:hypothetical protein
MTFGGKPGLVRAIWEHGLAGAGPVPAERRSDEMRVLETDPRKIIENWGILTTEVAPREGLSLAQARDVMWLYSSPEVYELLVLRQHWPLERFGRFVAESLVAALLPPGSG